MIGSCLFLNGDIEKINGGADIFDSITEKKLVMSRCLLSKRTEKDETFFTGNTQEGKYFRFKSRFSCPNREISGSTSRRVIYASIMALSKDLS